MTFGGGFVSEIIGFKKSEIKNLVEGSGPRIFSDLILCFSFFFIFFFQKSEARGRKKIDFFE